VRRLGLLCLACFAAVLLPLAAWGAGGGQAGIELTEAGGATFPERAFVLSLPGDRLLTAADVHAVENGQSVVDLSVTPASAAGGTTFGTVVVVDASESMRGAPIEAAMAAARAFAARRNPSERLAFLTFHGTPSVILPFTTSKTRIDAALATAPSVAYGTYIYDAVAKAETLLQSERVDSGSIVVLSDGADTGSTTPLAAVTAAARAHHIRLFTIGLHSPRFDPSSLETLAATGGGQYALAASTRDLAPLFDQLGARLAKEYLVRYKSLAGPKTRVRVSVSVNGVGGAAASAYQTPALPIKIAAPYHPSLANRFWGSAILMVVLALLAASVVALLAIGLLQPRRSGLPRRMAEFVSVPGLQTHDRRAAAHAEASTANDGSQGRVSLLARLDERLEIAQIKTSAPVLLLWTVAGTVIIYLLLALATGSVWWALLALLLPLGVREWVTRKLARRRKAFAEQLPDTLQVVAAALRSGQSFAGALAVVVESSSDPMKSEMQRVVAEEQLGVPLDKAVAVVVKRMQNRDLEQVALVAELQRESGGNSAEVVDRVAETVRERFELRRLINTLTIQGRMSRWIVSGLPVALLLFLSVINPHYIHPLVAHTAGKVLLGFATLLVIGGSLVIKKIVDIKV
jgi:Flp pilus assembly protein TadB/Mg-chelatase subunit ChlD